MNNLLEDKIELDNKIELLIEEFALKNKCGYEGSVSVCVVKETFTTGKTVSVGLNKTINTVITT